MKNAEMCMTIMPCIRSQKHALDETANSVLRDLLPDLEQSIIESLVLLSGI